MVVVAAASVTAGYGRLGQGSGRLEQCREGSRVEGRIDRIGDERTVVERTVVVVVVVATIVVVVVEVGSSSVEK